MFQKMFFILLLLVCACDPEGQKECAWTLEPEPGLIGKTLQGYIPVCARNRVSNKQDCRLQVRMEKAKEYFGKKFRYVDIVLESPALPRTIVQITFCEEAPK